MPSDDGPFCLERIGGRRGGLGEEGGLGVGGDRRGDGAPESNLKSWLETQFRIHQKTCYISTTALSY